MDAPSGLRVFRPSVRCAWCVYTGELRALNITFCEDGLSDSGELAFVAQLDIPDTPEADDFRMAVFRATPTP